MTTAHDHTELHRTADGTARLLVEGDLDVNAVPRFRAAVAEAAGEPMLLVDLLGCTFVDAAGLGALVGGIRRLQETGCRVVLVADLATAVGHLLTATGIDRLVPISRPAVAA